MVDIRSKIRTILIVSILNITIIYFIVWSVGYLSKIDINPRNIFGDRSWNNHYEDRRYQSKLNFTWIHHHPVYQKFLIKEVKKKTSVNVLVIVSSAPSHVDRRNAIRKTWWTQCITTNGITPACIFMTDYLSPEDQNFQQLQKENKLHNNDIRFQRGVGRGVAFGLRFINHMVFAVLTYNFDYLLRLDDDQFFCMDRFIREIPVPMLRNFHWGWVHFRQGVRRPEESIILFSRDVIEMFLTQDENQMLCHPWADQMIAIWLTNLKIKEILRHDFRIHHHPPPFMEPSLKRRPHLCQSFISIHGAYVSDMKLLWEHRGSKLKVDGDLEKNSSPVFIVKPFNWTRFFDKWRYRPLLCIHHPQWNTSKQMETGSSSYTGREFAEDVDFTI